MVKYSEESNLNNNDEKIELNSINDDINNTDITKMYNNLSKIDLLKKCNELGINKCSSKNKTELINLIKSKELEEIEDKTKIKLTKSKKQELEKIKLTESIEIKQKKRIVSLFAGCGGLDFGFINNNNYTHVLVNDHDKDACLTYENNFKIKPLCCDVKLLKDIPDFDLLIGGFPCQGFSMVNPYRSEDDSRNNLYLEIIRILKLKKPSYFLLENVKGILNMGGYDTNEDKKNQTGKIMKIILDDLKNCGYKVIFKLFNVKKYNVPQNRERVIFIGVKNDIAFEPIFKNINNNILTLKDAIGDLSIEYDETIQHMLEIES